MRQTRRRVWCSHDILDGFQGKDKNIQHLVSNNAFLFEVFFEIKLRLILAGKAEKDERELKVKKKQKISYIYLQHVANRWMKQNNRLIKEIDDM